ncbi:MAG TPA: tryptophanase [Ignavibacteria bacterium]|nr:tryptophanase [Ignavibacteria bacterium]HRA99066.1 tryptophanase [Ignavibacteria bacterium]
MKFKTIFEPFKIKSVEPIKLTSEEERNRLLEEADYNPFQLLSKNVLIDLLTDSGTSAMSSKQWSAIMDGDEAYAGSKSWIKMEKRIKDLTGFEYILPTHQGRAGERILYGYLGGKGKIFISNTHFDTTRANIEYSGAAAIDIPIAESNEPMLSHPFKGNMDTEKLKNLLKEYGSENIGGVILTVTNNSGGGQPVSMKNANEVSNLCRKFNVKFFLDCCRIAENSYFIRSREPGYNRISYKNIAKEMFALSDGSIMSAKKDGLVNMGGFLALKDKELYEACTNLLIITEGFVTYGGLTGRDMEAIAIGLKEVFDKDYLKYRIRSTEYLGEMLYKMGVPLIWPIGGHAVYIDAKSFYPHIPVEQYPGQALVCELYLKGGIRSVEIGSVMFGKYDKKGRLIPAPNELVRLAIPRRVYTQSHIEYVIEVFKMLIENKDSVKGMVITKEPEFLRHFTAKFKYAE